MNQEKAATLLAGANAWWDACLGLSPTRTLTKDQFVTKMAEMHSQDEEAFEELFDRIVDTMVGLVDVDDDGYVTKTEFENGIRSLGFNPIPHFDKMLAREDDANGILVRKMDEILEEFLETHGPDDDLMISGINEDSSG